MTPPKGTPEYAALVERMARAVFLDTTDDAYSYDALVTESRASWVSQAVAALDAIAQWEKEQETKTMETTPDGASAACPESCDCDRVCKLSPPIGEDEPIGFSYPKDGTPWTREHRVLIGTVVRQQISALRASHADAARERERAEKAEAIKMGLLGTLCPDAAVRLLDERDRLRSELARAERARDEARAERRDMEAAYRAKIRPLEDRVYASAAILARLREPEKWPEMVEACKAIWGRNTPIVCGILRTAASWSPPEAAKGGGA